MNRPNLKTRFSSSLKMDEHLRFRRLFSLSDVSEVPQTSSAIANRRKWDKTRKITKSNVQPQRLPQVQMGQSSHCSDLTGPPLATRLGEFRSIGISSLPVRNKKPRIFTSAAEQNLLSAELPAIVPNR